MWLFVFLLFLLSFGVIFIVIGIVFFKWRKIFTKNTRTIVKKYPKSTPFFLDLFLAKILLKKNKIVLEKVLSEIEENINSLSPENFRDFLLDKQQESWVLKNNEKASIVPTKNTDTSEERGFESIFEKGDKQRLESISSISTGKNNIINKGKSPKKSNLASKSIWDNYESVVDLMNKDKK